MCEELDDCEDQNMPSAYPSRPPFLDGPPPPGVHVEVRTTPQGETYVLVETGAQEGKNGPGCPHTMGNNNSYTYQGAPGTPGGPHGLHFGYPGSHGPTCGMPSGDYPTTQVGVCVSTGNAPVNLAPPGPSPCYSYAGPQPCVPPAWGGGGGWPEPELPDHDPYRVYVGVRVAT